MRLRMNPRVRARLDLFMVPVLVGLMLFTSWALAPWPHGWHWLAWIFAVVIGAAGAQTVYAYGRWAYYVGKLAELTELRAAFADDPPEFD